MLKTTANPIDKRRGLRRSAIEEQICLVELAGGRTAMLLDVSELGIGVQSVEGPIGQTTTPVRFQLPGSAAVIYGDGQVAWSDHTGCMGIRFTNVAPEMKEEIRKWVTTESNVLFDDRGDEESAVAQDARDRVAQLEARIMVSGWAQVQALNFLVDQVAAMTQASGVAIAVEDGNGIVCKASSGTAPQVGVRINSRSGLSWECARTGEVVHCIDTETDPRVDRIVCRQLNMRSAMLVPVKTDDRVTGLVEVFSSRAHAFNSSTVILLKSVAEAVSGIDDRAGFAEEQFGPQPVPDGQKPAAPRPKPLTAPAATPPVAAAPAPKPAPAVEQPAPVAVPKPVVVKPAPLEFPKPVSTPAPVEPPATQQAAVAKASEVVPAVAQRVDARTPAGKSAMTAGAAAAPAPAREESVPKNARVAAPERARAIEADREPRGKSAAAAIPQPASPAAEPAPIPEMFAAAEPDRASALPRWIAIGSVTAVLIGGVAFGVYRIDSASKRPADTRAPQATSAVVVTPPVQPTAPAAVPSSAPSASASTAAPAPAKVVAENAKPQPNTPVMEVAKASVPLRVARASEHHPDLAPVSAAAPLSVAPSNTAGVSSILSTAPVVPTLTHVSVSEGVSGGRQISRTEPSYPLSARALRISGTVVLEARISKAGTVSSIRVVSGSPILAAAAKDAVRRWRYEPFLLNGQAIENTITVRVDFRPPQ